MKELKIVYWLPRILSIAFILFLSLFSLDVFGEYAGWQAVLGFLIHLLPSFVLLAVVLVSWKYELVGAIAFFGAALFYVFAVGFDRPWSWYAAISGPAMLTAILFFINWLYKKRIIR